jgi:TPP-dependent pyruvate/acetoin dehydrogenase alpha subunit
VLALFAPALVFFSRPRQGDGPAYLVCNTYRFHGHHAGDPLNYREKEEVERWRLEDPIDRVRRVAIDRGVFSQDDLQSLEKEIAALIDDAVEFAKNSPDPSPDQLMMDIYA